MKVIVILNKHAGVVFKLFRRYSPEAVRKAFNAAGLEPAILFTKAGNMAHVLRQAVAERPDVIVVAGGDGSVNTAASILGGSGIALAVLPMGTFNLFARHMGLPFHPEKIARLVAQGHSTHLEVGTVNGRVFTLFSSIGVYPQFVRERKILQRRRGWWKPLAMFWALVKSMIRYPRFTLRIQSGGELRILNSASIIVTTTPGAVTPLILDDDGERYLTDNLLHLYVGRQDSRKSLFFSFVGIIFGGAQLKENFQTIPVTSLAVDVSVRKRSVLVACDGELFRLKPPLHYAIIPNHLRVILPKNEDVGRHKLFS